MLMYRHLTHLCGWCARESCLKIDVVERPLHLDSLCEEAITFRFYRWGCQYIRNRFYLWGGLHIYMYICIYIYMLR